jgi:hypothetical protein
MKTTAFAPCDTGAKETDEFKFAQGCAEESRLIFLLGGQMIWLRERSPSENVHLTQYESTQGQEFMVAGWQKWARQWQKHQRNNGGRTLEDRSIVNTVNDSCCVSESSWCWHEGGTTQFHPLSSSAVAQGSGMRVIATPKGKRWDMAPMRNKSLSTDKTN